MGLFDRIFGKKQTGAPAQARAGGSTASLQEGDTFISTGDKEGFKVIRPLTEIQKEKIARSTLLLRTGQLYMHYWTDHLACTDRNDPEWQNKVMFFWKAEEAFPRKSLPPVFETFMIKHFLFTGDTSRITLKVGQAIPWFGMPGLGEKYVCEMNGAALTVPELNELGLVEYVEPVELTNNNLDILTEREDYFFLIDDRITPFQQGQFYLRGTPVTIDVAYSIGGIHLVKKTAL